MDLTKILSIAGKPGLFILVGEAKNNIIVESMADGKKMPAFTHDRISALKEISIFTEDEDVPLKEVLQSIFKLQSEKPVADLKKASSNDIKVLFEKALPNYDKETVYVSDMKKIFGWYNLLLEKGLIDLLADEEETVQQETEPAEEQKEPAPKKARKKTNEKAE
jgi:hypothetical protein